MAIFHCEFKLVRRAEERMPGGRSRSGRSVVAAAAYRAGQKLTDEHAGGIDHDYSRRSHVLAAEILAPAGAPEWAQDRQRLWNEVEQAEKRKDARLAREVELALPHELSREQQRELVRAYVQQQFVSRGMIADVAYHEADRGAAGRNDHAHVLLTMREIGPEGFGKKVREWNDRELVIESREAWARTTNQHLSAEGHQARIDHRSLAEQREEAERNGDFQKAHELARVPQVHKGPTITALERAGIDTEGARAFRHRAAQPERQVETERIREQIAEKARRLEAVRDPQRAPSPAELKAAREFREELVPPERRKKRPEPQQVQEHTREPINAPGIERPRARPQPVQARADLELARSDPKACAQMYAAARQAVSRELEQMRPEIARQMEQQRAHIDRQKRELTLRDNQHRDQESRIAEQLSKPWNKIQGRRRDELETALMANQMKRAMLAKQLQELDQERRRNDPKTTEGEQALRAAAVERLERERPALVQDRDALSSIKTAQVREHEREARAQAKSRDTGQERELER